MKDYKPQVFYKEISASSVTAAGEKMDEWGQSRYDMFIIELGPCEKRDGYVRARIWGFEYDKERTNWLC